MDVKDSALAKSGINSTCFRGRKHVLHINHLLPRKLAVQPENLQTGKGTLFGPDFHFDLPGVCFRDIQETYFAVCPRICILLPISSIEWWYTYLR